MPNTIFDIHVTLKKNEPLNFEETAVVLIDLLSNLAEFDDVFSSFVFSTEKIKSPILIDELGREKAIEYLANTLLRSSKGYIKSSLVNPVEPNLEYKWNRGFRYLLNFRKENKLVFSLTGNIGGDNYSEIRAEYFYSKLTYSLDWFETVLKKIILQVNASNALIGINGLPKMNDKIEKLRPNYRLGWITYFANDCFEIPNDFEGIEYEFSENGKFLILSREGFENDPTRLYEERVNQLIQLMDEFKERVPGYCKN